MLFELSIYPIGEIHMSTALAGALKIIHESKIPYKVTPKEPAWRGSGMK